MLMRPLGVEHPVPLVACNRVNGVRSGQYLRDQRESARAHMVMVFQHDTLAASQGVRRGGGEHVGLRTLDVYLEQVDAVGFSERDGAIECQDRDCAVSNHQSVIEAAFAAVDDVSQAGRRAKRRAVCLDAVPARVGLQRCEVLGMRFKGDDARLACVMRDPQAEQTDVRAQVEDDVMVGRCVESARGVFLMAPNFDHGIHKAAACAGVANDGAAPEHGAIEGLPVVVRPC